MSIEFKFSNNIFNFAEYEKFVDEYIEANISEPKSEEEVLELQSRIDRLFTEFQKNIKIKHPLGSQEYNKITKLIEKIIGYEPGRQLIEGLIQANAKISIECTDTVDAPQYSQYRREMLLPQNSKDTYIITNSDGKRAIQKSKKFVILAHELIHALHHAKDPRQAQKDHNTIDGLIDQTFDNQEEQDTISGMRKNHQGVYFFKPICENLLWKVAQHNMRVGHQGLIVPRGTDIGTVIVIDALCHRTSAEVLPLLEKMDTAQLNQIYEFQGKNYTLMSLALIYGKTDVFDYLLSRGADVNAIDDIGGPLHAAVKSSNAHAVRQILAAGIKPQIGHSWLVNLIEAFRCRANQNETEDVLLSILEKIPPKDPTLNENSLRSACRMGLEKVVAKLIELEVDLNAIDPRDGNTPLMFLLQDELRKKEEWEERKPFTVAPESRRIINHLMQTGKIDLSITNKDGQTASSMAAELGINLDRANEDNQAASSLAELLGFGWWNFAPPLHLNRSIE